MWPDIWAKAFEEETDAAPKLKKPRSTKAAHLERSNLTAQKKHLVASHAELHLAMNPPGSDLSCKNVFFTIFVSFSTVL